MNAAALEKAARTAARAADLARAETLPRFRSVAVETKADGSPVTEADRAAERVIRGVLRESYPDFGVLGEEYGDERTPGDEDRPRWVVDPIDGTIAYSRGIPLFSTLIALVEDGIPVLGLIDLPALDERYIGWKNGGCYRNEKRVQVSRQTDLRRSIISHGDPICFEWAGQRAAFERMGREIPLLRGYTDAFGHALVLSGGVDAMVDCDLNLWDAAATQVLTGEAGGRCESLHRDHKIDLVFGSPALVDQLLDFLAR
jgi:histidinol phosphatase-like enzyme (inositol monophosphatase family)